MKIETLTVKALRSMPGEYGNDAIELSVSLEDDEDWKAIEPILRDQAVELMAQHWARKRALKVEEQQAYRKSRIKERDRWLEEDWESNDWEPPCDECKFVDTCDECPHCETDGDFADDDQPF